MQNCAFQGNKCRAVCCKIFVKGKCSKDKCCKIVLLKEVASWPIKSGTKLRDDLKPPPWLDRGGNGGPGIGRHVPRVRQGVVDELASQSRLPNHFLSPPFPLFLKYPPRLLLLQAPRPPPILQFSSTAPKVKAWD